MEIVLTSIIVLEILFAILVIGFNIRILFDKDIREFLKEKRIPNPWWVTTSKIGLILGIPTLIIVIYLLIILIKVINS